MNHDAKASIEAINAYVKKRRWRNWPMEITLRKVTRSFKRTLRMITWKEGRYDEMFYLGEDNVFLNTIMINNHAVGAYVHRPDQLAVPEDDLDNKIIEDFKKTKQYDPNDPSTLEIIHMYIADRRKLHGKIIYFPINLWKEVIAHHRRGYIGRVAIEALAAHYIIHERTHSHQFGHDPFAEQVINPDLSNLEEHRNQKHEIEANRAAISWLHCN